MDADSDKPTGRYARAARVLAVTLMGVASSGGCSREFYRQWANQDASEAVFEKSRDPRWRLDLFSIEPPAQARYADPYDPDTPPAPPDDHAAERLSPVPQWPGNRLLIPVEGTGYLDMLDEWQRQRPPRQPRQGPAPVPRAGATAPPTPAAPAPPGASATPPAGPVATPPSEEPGPAPTPLPPPPPIPPAAAANSGTGADAMSPNPLPALTPVPGLPTGPAAMVAAAPDPSEVPAHDHAVAPAALQEPATTPVPPPPPVPAVPEAPPAATPLPGPGAVPPLGTGRETGTPPIGMDPNPINSDLSAPVTPRSDLAPGDVNASELGAEIAGVLVPGRITLDEAEAAGLPRNSTPYLITMEQAFRLALVNSRTYQFRVENMYVASLAVTLQRFAFQPQFYAGLSPTTGVAGQQFSVPGPGGGFPGTLPPNSFLYRTRETGSPASTLSIGTVAGVGKAFSTGARVLAGFANQVVFNFLGKHPIQPSVQSSLPLTIVQPFLRGGGRAVVLELLTQAERNLLYEIRTFAKFRQEFVVANLVGGVFQNFGSTALTQGFSAGGGTNEPVIGFINVLQDLQTVENDQRNIAAFEVIVTVYRELIKGESSGLSQLQLDQVESGLQSARQQLVQDRTTYRSDLDQFKIQMGLPPDVPLMPDRGLTAPFTKTFNDIDAWQRNPKREMSDLPTIVAQLPELEKEDIVIDGRSVLGIYRDGKNDEDDLEDLLIAAERTALEHRLDLMNVRAQLYDAWRQIRVTANALRGILNVSLTNQFVTPPSTTNPFGFVDQAKQFSLVINAELPLVRLAERNNFRSAMIGYQRQRRVLMNAEDFLKYQVRQDVRVMQQQYLIYTIARRNFILTVRQKDQAFENIIAPPAGAAGAAQNNQGAIQTTNLIQFQQRLLGLQSQLVAAWQQFELARLTLYRDLGTLPYDEWEALYELYPPDTNRGGAGDVVAAPGPPRAEPVAPAGPVAR